MKFQFEIDNKHIMKTLLDIPDEKSYFINGCAEEYFLCEGKANYRFKS